MKKYRECTPGQKHAWRSGFMQPTVQTKNRSVVKWIPKQPQPQTGTEVRKEPK